MFFRSYRPIRPLSDFIESFWLYNGFQSPRLKERILPTGTFELVFNLQQNELPIYRAAQPTRRQRFSGAIVTGPYEEFFLTDSADEAAVMGVHFKPGGVFPFFGISADELTGTHVDLEAIWGRAAVEIRERLCVAPSPIQRFRLLERLLILRFRPWEHHPSVSLALERVRQDKSRAVIRKLAQDAGLSDRRFIDVFRFEVGLTPKIFARIQRFQSVLAQAHSDSDPNWAQLALGHGYFDQSHLIRDFLAFSGLSPADYVGGLNDLRRKGLHVKFNHFPLLR